MQLHSSPSHFWIFFSLILGILIVWVVYITPIDIPKGFPYIAKAVSSNELIQAKTPETVQFIDMTLQSGLSFVHQQGDEKLAGIDESLGSGACAADFNNDGWVDLFLVNGSGHTRYYGKEYWWQASQGNALFINENGQRFKDATSASGLDKKIWGMGCLVADFDNDGDIDLFVTGKDINLLYSNDGNGHFSDVTQDSGILGGFWSTSAAAADLNRDGLLDIYVGNFIDFQKGTKTFEANSQFLGERKNTFDASLYQAQANKLYLNLGGLKFKDITADAGVNDSDGRTLDVSWQYINSDELPDLLITNGRGTGSNASYLNKEGKKFESGDQTLGLRSALGNRGIASGDLDNDGDIDFVIASPIGENTIALIDRQSTDGKTYYKDAAREIGIGANQYLYLSAWTPMVQDFNRDGHNDIFMASGHLEPDPDAAKVPQGQPKQLLLNQSDGTFVDVTAASGQGLLDAQSARGVVAADFDNDGDVDLYVSHNNDLGQYLVNTVDQQHWLGLKLLGTQSNKDALGAKVELFSAQGVQTKRIVSGEGFLSDSDKRILFGLGEQTTIERLVITWPSGNQQTIKLSSIDQYWLIEEGRDQPQVLNYSQAGRLNTKRLRLKLGAENADVRVEYIKLLTRSTPDDETWRELAIGLADNDVKVRQAVIETGARFKSPQGLSLLVRGLEDANDENVLMALAGLKTYEDEFSIRWLLRTFSHQSAAVKTALADDFAYFFQEEEAVIHRKYLAVPYLTRLLDDPVPQVRIAAARALAGAEHYRGVHALQDHLNDPNTDSRAEVVRSLGLIRQVQALPRLKTLLQDQTQPPKVIANVMIALKRLGGDNALKLLDAYVMAQDEFQSIAVEQRLGVLAEIFAQEHDASVFDLEKLRQIARAAFEKFLANPIAANNLNRYWMSIWQNLPDKVAENWLDQQTHSVQAEMRLLAFKALLTQGKDQYLSRAWADQDSAINQWALNQLLNNKRQLTKVDYQRIIDNPLLRSTALQIWSEIGFHDQPIKLIEALLNNLGHGHVKKVVSSGDAVAGRFDELNLLCTSSDPEFQGFCSLLLFSEHSTEHLRMASKILHDQAFPVAVRQLVLKNYTVDFDPDAINGLYALVQAKKEALRVPALQKLFSFDSDSLIELAEKIANNVAEDARIRFQAIDFLVRRGRPQARDILYR